MAKKKDDSPLQILHGDEVNILGYPRGEQEIQTRMESLPTALMRMHKPIPLVSVAATTQDSMAVRPRSSVVKIQASRFENWRSILERRAEAYKQTSKLRLNNSKEWFAATRAWEHLQVESDAQYWSSPGEREKQTSLQQEKARQEREAVRRSVPSFFEREELLNQLFSGPALARQAGTDRPGVAAVIDIKAVAVNRVVPDVYKTWQNFYDEALLPTGSGVPKGQLSFSVASKRLNEHPLMTPDIKHVLSKAHWPINLMKNPSKLLPESLPDIQPFSTKENWAYVHPEAGIILGGKILHNIAPLEAGDTPGTVATHKAAERILSHILMFSAYTSLGQPLEEYGFGKGESDFKAVQKEFHDALGDKKIAKHMDAKLGMDGDAAYSTYNIHPWSIIADIHYLLHSADTQEIQYSQLQDLMPQTMAFYNHVQAALDEYVGRDTPKQLEIATAEETIVDLKEWSPEFRGMPIDNEVVVDLKVQSRGFINSLIDDGYAMCACEMKMDDRYQDNIELELVMQHPDGRREVYKANTSTPYPSVARAYKYAIQEVIAEFEDKKRLEPYRDLAQEKDQQATGNNAISNKTILKGRVKHSSVEIDRDGALVGVIGLRQAGAASHAPMQLVRIPLGVSSTDKIADGGDVMEVAKSRLRFACTKIDGRGKKGITSADLVHELREGLRQPESGIGESANKLGWYSPEKVALYDYRDQPDKGHEIIFPKSYEEEGFEQKTYIEKVDLERQALDGNHTYVATVHMRLHGVDPDMPGIPLPVKIDHRLHTGEMEGPGGAKALTDEFLNGLIIRLERLDDLHWQVNTSLGSKKVDADGGQADNPDGWRKQPRRSVLELVDEHGNRPEDPMRPALLAQVLDDCPRFELRYQISHEQGEVKQDGLVPFTVFICRNTDNHGVMYKEEHEKNPRRYQYTFNVPNDKDSIASAESIVKWLDEEFRETLYTNYAGRAEVKGQERRVKRKQYQPISIRNALRFSYGESEDMRKLIAEGRTDELTRSVMDAASGHVAELRAGAGDITDLVGDENREEDGTGEPGEGMGKDEAKAGAGEQGGPPPAEPGADVPEPGYDTAHNYIKETLTLKLDYELGGASIVIVGFIDNALKIAQARQTPFSYDEIAQLLENEVTIKLDAVDAEVSGFPAKSYPFSVLDEEFQEAVRRYLRDAMTLGNEDALPDVSLEAIKAAFAGDAVGEPSEENAGEGADKPDTPLADEQLGDSNKDGAAPEGQKPDTGKGVGENLNAGTDALPPVETPDGQHTVVDADNLIPPEYRPFHIITDATEPFDRNTRDRMIGEIDTMVSQKFSDASGAIGIGEIWEDARSAIEDMPRPNRESIMNAIETAAYLDKNHPDLHSFENEVSDILEKPTPDVLEARERAEEAYTEQCRAVPIGRDQATTLFGLIKAEINDEIQSSNPNNPKLPRYSRDVQQIIRQFGNHDYFMEDRDELTVDTYRDLVRGLIESNIKSDQLDDFVNLADDIFTAAATAYQRQRYMNRVMLEKGLSGDEAPSLDDPIESALMPDNMIACYESDNNRLSPENAPAQIL